VKTAFVSNNRLVVYGLEDLRLEIQADYRRLLLVQANAALNLIWSNR